MYEGLHRSGRALACGILGSGSSPRSTDIGMCTNREVSSCVPRTWQEASLKKTGARLSVYSGRSAQRLLALLAPLETALNRAESASTVLVREAGKSFPNRVLFTT